MPSTTLKQCASAWCFAPMLSPQELARALRDLGYAGVELAPQEDWPVYADAGLAIASANGHRSIEEGLNRREHHARIEGEILANLELAVRWSIPNLIVFSGNRAGLDDRAGAEATVEGLRRVAGAAEQAGVTLVLELLNSKVDHPDYQCDHTAWGIEVVRQVDSPRVRLLYDIYHMQIMEGDVIRTIRDHHQWFGHYHTAGNPGRHEIGPDQELQYPPIVRAIAATGYDGWLGQEFVPTGDPVAGLRQAFDLCTSSS